MNRTQDF